MTFDKLPDELKSGRVLVATAAEENIGLYTYLGMDDDYRIVTRAGTVTRGDGETVPQPPSGHWRYLTNNAGERIADGAESDEEQDDDEEPTEADESEEVEVEVLELADPPADPPSDDTDVPEEWACLDCGCNVRKLEHAHTTGRPVRYLCCPCAVKQGRTRSASLSSDSCRLKKGAQ